MSGLKIIVAAHKPYRMPEDAAYLPVQVGAAGKPSIGDWQRDDAGESISVRNANWCELTGLYWAWKNLPADVLGLVHYRRHFKGKGGIATGAEIAASLENADVILPRKRNYFIETNYSQYAHAHHEIDLDETRRIIGERCPEYLPAFDRTMKRTSGHRFNMFVMRREVADRYCTWLFDILFELERRLDISKYSTNDARVFGFVAERLMDVWIETNGFVSSKHGGTPRLLTYVELPVLNLESQHWPRKIVNFLRRKFRY